MSLPLQAVVFAFISIVAGACIWFTAIAVGQPLSVFEAATTSQLSMIGLWLVSIAANTHKTRE